MRSGGGWLKEVWEVGQLPTSGDLGPACMLPWEEGGFVLSSSPSLAPPVKHHYSQLLLGVDGVQDQDPRSSLMG